MNTCFLLSPLGVIGSFILVMMIVWSPVWLERTADRKYVQRNGRLISDTSPTFYLEHIPRKQPTNVLVKERSKGSKLFFYEEEITNTWAKRWVRKEKEVIPEQRPIRALLPPATIITLDSFYKEEINETRVRNLRSKQPIGDTE